ncbi:MAG: hypothetical protein D6696_00855 [Acidobacteria bacterium]|nr:MAG: hypothetical protein D6696_00855 [Acidobacteriota bacterium]
MSGASARARRHRLCAERRGLVLLLAAQLLAGCGREALDARQPPPSPSPPAVAAPAGDGLVVWESDRSGAWRIWIRPLDGGPPRRLSPDEPGRAHCCPHLSPDGAGVVYLSLPRGAERYPQSGAEGVLRLIRPDGTGDRLLAPRARTYFEHRAAVWRDGRQLIYVAGDGATRLLELASGESRPLTAPRVEPHGWLIDPTLRHAVIGTGTLAVYDPSRRRVDPDRPLGGCQPYFSHDGRWVYWVAGAGGPIRARELASGRLITLLRKNDPRLPPGRGYVYFPMLAADLTLLAVAASEGEHDHQRADYDVFVVETDPQTLEVIGEAWRVTDHPATDRFPDVYRAPLALGRHFGEAPLTVELAAADGDPAWSWELGDGGRGRGARVVHTYREPGTYAPLAERSGRLLRGLVRVRPARPPAVVHSALAADGRHVVVHFDEPVDAARARAELASGLGIRRLAPGADGRSLEIELAAPLSGTDVLRLAGVRDRAGTPNAMPPVELEIAPPRWPSDRRGLVFLWRTAGDANRVDDPARGGPRASRLEPHGRAWLDRNGAMVLRGGYFLADMETMERVLEGAKATNELTFEATLTPGRDHGADLARIFTFSPGERSRNVTLGQIGRRPVYRLRTAENVANADRPEIVLPPIPLNRPSHLILSYTPGRLVAYVDGEPVLESDELAGGFFHWQPRPFLFGNEWQAEHPWWGTLEGVAIYNRFVDGAEARENARRYRAELAARPRVPQLVVKATLTARSATPTLEQIAPYREALAVYEYRVDEVRRGRYDGRRLRVVHRVLADGETLPIVERPPGSTLTLLLEPFAAQPQLESLYLSETLPEDYSLELFYALEP